jgi:hypothetical protein
MGAAPEAAVAHRALRPGGRPSLLHDLAQEITSATGAAPVHLAHLSRFTWKKALGLASALLVLHLLLPQLASAGSAMSALHHANW